LEKGNNYKIVQEFGGIDHFKKTIEQIYYMQHNSLKIQTLSGQFKFSKNKSQIP